MIRILTHIKPLPLPGPRICDCGEVCIQKPYITKISKQQSWYWRCPKCLKDKRQKYKEQIKNIVTRYRNRNKMECFNYLGGPKCCRCGDTSFENLEFHHKNPNTKSFTIGRTNYLLKNIKEELDKCEILCNHCHYIEHFANANVNINTSHADSFINTTIDINISQIYADECSNAKSGSLG